MLTLLSIRNVCIYSTENSGFMAEKVKYLQISIKKSYTCLCSLVSFGNVTYLVPGKFYFVLLYFQVKTSTLEAEISEATSESHLFYNKGL